jgi:hypothetical protein
VDHCSHFLFPDDGDTQTMIKNIMFCIAKQKILDSSGKFYIFQTGTDRLEKGFGRVRMLGEHDSTMNYKQGIERFGHAEDIDAIFEKHSDWDSGPRRLKMTRVEHVDHLNPESWEGDLCVGNVSLVNSWKEGMEAARDVLVASQVPYAQFHYSTVFEDGVDLLHPWGGDHYPGVASEPDRSLIEELLEDDPVTVDAVEQAVGQDQTTEPEESIAAVTNLPNETTADLETPTAVTMLPVDGDEYDDLCLWEETLPDPPSLMPPVNATTVSRPPAGTHASTHAEDYLEYKGEYIHKSSFCRLCLSRDAHHMSHDRLSRWKGLSSTHHQLSDAMSSADDSTGEVLGDNLVPCDLVATLLCSNTTLSLAVISVTGIHKGTHLLTSIDLDALSHEKQGIRITGQLLSLTAVPSVLLRANTENLALAGDPEQIPEDAGAAWSWIWTGGYVTSASLVSATGHVVQKSLSVTVPGHLTTTLNPQIISAKSLKNLELTDEQHRKLNSQQLLWVFDSTALGVVRDALWEKVTALELLPTSLVTVKPSTLFPYQHKNEVALIPHGWPIEEFLKSNLKEKTRVCTQMRIFGRSDKS